MYIVSENKNPKLNPPKIIELMNVKLTHNILQSLQNWINQQFTILCEICEGKFCKNERKVESVYSPSNSDSKPKKRFVI